MKQEQLFTIYKGGPSNNPSEEVLPLAEIPDHAAGELIKVARWVLDQRAKGEVFAQNFGGYLKEKGVWNSEFIPFRVVSRAAPVGQPVSQRVDGESHT